MLIISQKTNDYFYIGKDIKVHILRIKGDVVRIGIDAPKEVDICRHNAHIKKDSNKDII